MNYINLPKRKELIEKYQLKILPREESYKALTYIGRNFPTMSNGLLYWEKYGGAYKQLKWEDASDEETRKFIKSTSLGKYRVISSIYQSNQQGIIGDFNIICDNLEILVRMISIFLVGVKQSDDGSYHVVPEDFVELNEWEGILTAPIYS